jgi:2,5-diketo-D-gluconate reductase A
MTDVNADRTLLLPGNVRMPLIGFGTWQVTGNRGYQAMRLALDAGYRHLDTATMYGNESLVGRAVRDSGLPREDVFVTTKLLPSRSGRERETLDESLRALGMAYVDLWLIHWPPGRRAGVDSWRQFLAARNAGLARSVGVSNYRTGQIDELIAATGEAPAVNQIPWSPFLFDPRTVAESRDRGVALEGYSPFKRSDLRHPVLRAIAERHGVTPAQVVLRWHVEHRIAAIPKSVTPDRIRANIDVFGFALGPDEVGRIDGLAR